MIFKNMNDYREWLEKDEQWETIAHLGIKPHIYKISSYGRIKDEMDVIKDVYHSTNGYDFICLQKIDDTKQLFPIDELVCETFIRTASTDVKIGNPLKTIHIDGDTRNNHASNLEFAEDIEEWKVIEYDNIKPNMYEISNWGNIRRLQDKHIMKYKYLPNNYRVITLNGKTRRLNRLVATMFNSSKYNKKYDVNHIDGNPDNNYWKNLEWVSHKQNMYHANYVGLWNINKITNQEIKLVRKLLIENEYKPSRVIKLIDKDKFPHITINTIYDIKRNRYKNIDVVIMEKSKKRKRYTY